MSELLLALLGEDGFLGELQTLPPRGLVRRWDSTSQQWVPCMPRIWNGTAWVYDPDYEYTWTFRTPFEPTYIGAGTIWQRDVSSMPIATLSDDFANWMATHINYAGGFGPTSINTSAAGTHPIQCYVVDSRMPNCNYQYISNASGNFGSAYASSIMSGFVPWPKWAFTPQAGQDSALAIFDIGSGILREYYLVSRVAGYSNKWTCITGGYSVAPKDLVNWPDYNYATHLTEGSNAVVRMHNHLGFIDIAGSRRGQIDHAIAYTCANMNVPTSSGEAIMLNGTRYTSVGPSWPALGGDGDSTGSDIPIHGQWARLPMSLDLSATGPYPPFLRMVIKAIQTYGMVCTDSNNFVHAFNAEPGYADVWWLGKDPWTFGGDLFQQYAALNIAEGRDETQPFNMASFPWDETEWAPRNWGKPE